LLIHQQKQKKKSPAKLLNNRHIHTRSIPGIEVGDEISVTAVVRFGNIPETKNAVSGISIHDEARACRSEIAGDCDRPFDGNLFEEFRCAVYGDAYKDVDGCDDSVRVLGVRRKARGYCAGRRQAVALDEQD